MALKHEAKRVVGGVNYNETSRFRNGWGVRSIYLKIALNCARCSFAAVTWGLLTMKYRQTCGRSRLAILKNLITQATLGVALNAVQ